MRPSSKHEAIREEATGGARRPLEALEDKAPTNSEWVIPIEVRILTKAVARHHALEDGRKPPPYTSEEIAELRKDDLEIVAGGGVVGACRAAKGWQSQEARELLADWTEDARRRVAAGKDLPPERWHEVWGRDENENEKG